EGLQRTIAIMGRQVHKLTRLVDDLLDMTRVSQGKLTLRHDLVDLRDVVPAAVESVEHQIISQGLKLNLSMPANPVYVRGDVTRLEQILANLLSNATKYTESSGKIDVEVERRDNE